jgi:hypothetical protein
MKKKKKKKLIGRSHPYRVAILKNIHSRELARARALLFEASRTRPSVIMVEAAILMGAGVIAVVVFTLLFRLESVLCVCLCVCVLM